MDYRDERDALRGRVENLEQELEEAQRALGSQHVDDKAARIAQLEQQLADAQALLREVGRELSAVKGTGEMPPPKQGVPILGQTPQPEWRRVTLILAGLTLALSAVTLAAKLRAHAPAHVTVPPPPPVAPVESGQTGEPPMPVEPPVPVAPSQRPGRSEPHVAPRFAKPRWSASVQRAEGIALAPGTPCTLDATVEAVVTNARVADLELACAGRTLYRKSDSFSGMAKIDNDARERLGRRDDQSTFTLQYNDIGARTGARSQVDLDSTKRTGAVFRETSPRWRVELTMPVESQPTAPLSGAAQRLRREGRVTKVSGATLVSPGATCVLRAMPTGYRDACVAELLCGAAVLFPAGSGVRCTYDGARPDGVESAGDLPTLRLEGQTLQVQTASRAVISLELQ
jgi:hypothetical protein